MVLNPQVEGLGRGFVLVHHLNIGRYLTREGRKREIRERWFRSWEP